METVEPYIVKRKAKPYIVAMGGRGTGRAFVWHIITKENFDDLPCTIQELCRVHIDKIKEKRRNAGLKQLTTQEAYQILRLNIFNQQIYNPAQDYETQGNGKKNAPK